MFQDMNKVVVGGFLMFLFMVLVLSKFGWVELRVSNIRYIIFVFFYIEAGLTLEIAFLDRFYCAAWV